MATFYNHTSNTLISGTDEADTILNQFIWDGSEIDSNVTIQGNGGDDIINNHSGYKTYIDGGSGNDSIINGGGNYISILSGDGDDTIENFTGGNEYIAKNSYINTGDGNDYIDDEGTNSYIDSGLGNDTIYARGENETIIGNLGDDYIGVTGSNIVIYAGDGDDSFQVSGTAENVRVISGNGNDSIINKGNNSSFHYSLGDGNDTIWGYTSADTLNISGASYSSVESGNDIIITVGEGTDSVGTITLVDAAGTALNVASDGGSTDSGGGTDTTSGGTTIATDYVFIFDTSGSMSTYINRVKDIAANFTSQLTSAGVDYRLGIVEYEDADNIATYDFTTDIDTFTNNVSTIAEKAYGGDEYGLTAIETALIMDYREGAEKKLILLTDEDYDDSSSTLDSTTVISDLNNNSVILDVIGEKDSGYSYSCEDAWTPIAQATGGDFYDINGDYNLIFGEIAVGGGKMKLSNWSYHFNFPESDSTTPVLTTSAT